MRELSGCGGGGAKSVITGVGGAVATGGGVDGVDCSGGTGSDGDGTDSTGGRTGVAGGCSGGGGVNCHDGGTGLDGAGVGPTGERVVGVAGGCSSSGAVTGATGMASSGISCGGGGMTGATAPRANDGGGGGVGGSSMDPDPPGSGCCGGACSITGNIERNLSSISSMVSAGFSVGNWASSRICRNAALPTSSGLCSSGVGSTACAVGLNVGVDNICAGAPPN
jgi:hypothetical protein